MLSQNQTDNKYKILKLLKLSAINAESFLLINKRYYSTLDY